MCVILFFLDLIWKGALFFIEPILVQFSCKLPHLFLTNSPQRKVSVQFILQYYATSFAKHMLTKTNQLIRMTQYIQQVALGLAKGIQGRALNDCPSRQ